MILDKVENISRYFKAPILEEIFQKLKDFDINTPNSTLYAHNNKVEKLKKIEIKIDETLFS